MIKPITIYLRFKMSNTLTEIEQNIGVTTELRIVEAIGVIDRALGTMVTRKLVSTDEVGDLLLDLRTLLTGGDTSTAPEA
jgi:hypothetical protein